MEHPDPRVRQVLATDLREHGYHVLTCGGPADPGAAGVCPLVHGDECPGVVGADAVVVGGADQHPLHRVVVERITTAHPHLPVIEDADLGLVGPFGIELGPHQRYRRIVAPLVRRLHEVLHATRPARPTR